MRLLLSGEVGLRVLLSGVLRLVHVALFLTFLMRAPPVGATGAPLALRPG
jgi:hypothetical protein